MNRGTRYWAGGSRARVAARVSAGIALAALVVGGLPCSAEMIRYHGMQLDETNRLILAEDYGEVRIGLLKRTRTEGGAPVPGTRFEHRGELGRYTDAEFLVAVRAEVIRPAAPNYLQNPGQLYRITVRGLSVEPDYAGMLEVDADQARDAVIYELERLRAGTIGINNRALLNAGPLLLEVFKEAGRLPARIEDSVKESRSGKFRITSGSQQRRGITPLEAFAPELEIDRPEAGAMERARKKDAAPKGAASPGGVRGPSATPTGAGPGTPAAAGQRTRTPSSASAIRSEGFRPAPGAAQAPGDMRYTGHQTLYKAMTGSGIYISEKQAR